MTRFSSSPSTRRIRHAKLIGEAATPMRQLANSLDWLRAEAALLAGEDVRRLAARAERVARRLNDRGLRRPVTVREGRRS